MLEQLNASISSEGRMKRPTISSFIKAMAWITEAGKYDDLVPPILQRDGGVNDQPLGATNPQIRM